MDLEMDWIKNGSKYMDLDLELDPNIWI